MVFTKCIDFQFFTQRWDEQIAISNGRDCLGSFSLDLQNIHVQQHRYMLFKNHLNNSGDLTRDQIVCIKLYSLYIAMQGNYLLFPCRTF